MSACGFEDVSLLFSSFLRPSPIGSPRLFFWADEALHRPPLYAGAS